MVQGSKEGAQNGAAWLEQKIVLDEGSRGGRLVVDLYLGTFLVAKAGMMFQKQG